MKTRRETGRTFLYCLLLLLLLLFVYRDVLLHPDELLFVGCWDSWWLFGPNQVFFDYCVEQGEFPLWNPLVFCGTPFAANPQVQAFHLPNFLRSFFTPEATAMWTHIGLFALTLLQVFLGGVGVLLLAKFHGLRLPSRFVAALVFMLCAGAMRRTVTTPIWPMISAWLPFIILLIHKGLRSNKLSSGVYCSIPAGLLYSLILTAGQTQFAIYIGALAGIYAIADSFLRTNSAAFSWKLGFRRTKKAVLLLSVMLFTAFFAALPLILTAQEFGTHSTRASIRDVSQFEPIEFSTAPRHILESLVVFPRCEENTRINSAGLIALVLAMAGILVFRDRSALVYAVLFYVVLDFGLGPPFPFATLIQTTVPFSFSSSTYAWFLLTFPLAMLAGFGVEAVTEGNALKNRLIRALAMLAVFAVAYWAFSSCEHPVIQAPVYLLLVPIAALVCILPPLLFHWRATCHWLLCGFIAIELLLWNAVFLPYVYSPDVNFVSNQHRFPGSLEALRAPLQFWETNRRTIYPFPFENYGMYRLNGAISGHNPLQIDAAYKTISRPQSEQRYSRIVGMRACLSNSYINLFLKRPFWLVKHGVVGPLPPKDALFPPCGFAFLEESPDRETLQEKHTSIPSTSLLEPRAEMEFESTTINAAMKVQTNTRTGQTICTFGASEVTKSSRHGALLINCDTNAEGELTTSVVDEATGRRMPLLSVNLERGVNAIELPLPDLEAFEVNFVAYLDAPEARFSLNRLAVATDDADEDDHIHIRYRTANEVAVRVSNLEGPRILLFTDADYPEWSATVDGREVPVFRANKAFKAVELPPGDHEIVFTFKSLRAYMGIAIGCVFLSLLSLFGLGVTLHGLLKTPWSPSRDTQPNP
ncbi:MAG: YfhO family protein [Candidatus Hydrogenedentota bacterium]